ncbi:TAP-like protein-domain-containing protein [Cantharellus anzutake]|uniref:TAP-like protein-domain-containing protein n=1 Tax=Cantharellus anzutake TaxID=1750568 RepID=UPI0019059A9F|nr:TAP-like protein-domain-containing protein [Cantharellus anzutake]KAF8335935.1 TAP-like protein-domain-containing protein [Cantharellus anzutake]
MHLSVRQAVVATIVFLSSLITTVVAYDRYSPIAKNTTWSKCPDDPTFLCGTFDVPLDWTPGKESRGKATLAVIKYPATRERKGSLFVNPGGPGDSGLGLVLSRGTDLSNRTGGYYDIVSFDPRGVGLTMPRIDCFNSTDEEQQFWNGTVVYQSNNGLEAKGNFTSSNQTDPDVVAFWKQEPEVDSLLGQVGQLCLQMNGDNLEFVGTAAVVRDIIAMADAYDGDGSLVYYWGFSYGTVIGAYLVNMFPDRVGHVVIDGVVNTLLWATEPSYKAWAYKIQDTPKVFQGFAGACAMAGPSGCAIAEKGSTNETITQWVQGLMDAAYDYYKGGGTEASSALIRNMLFQAMYNPTGWPKLASDLYSLGQLLFQNGGRGSKRGLPSSDLLGLETNSWLSPPGFGPLGLRKKKTNPVARRHLDRLGKRDSGVSTYDYASQAITCADAVDAGNVTTSDVFGEILLASQNVSEMFGPMFADAGFWCHKWPSRATERFTGPWNSTLKNKILVVGNQADPITPYPGAKLVADLLGEANAVIVEQRDFGHTSLAEHSDCTFRVIYDYFANGTLPVDESICGTNQVLFPGSPVTKLSLEYGGSLDPQLNPNVPIPHPPGSELLATNDNNDTTKYNIHGDNSTLTALENEINSLKSTRQTLLIALGSLGAAFLSFLVATGIIICCRRRRSKSGSTYYIPTSNRSSYFHSNRSSGAYSLVNAPLLNQDKSVSGHTTPPGGVAHHRDASHGEDAEAFIPPSTESTSTGSGRREGAYMDPYDPPLGAVGGSSYGDGGRGYSGR